MAKLTARITLDASDVLSGLHRQNLAVGDIVRHKLTGDGYVIIYTDGKNIMATRTLAISNPDEWERVGYTLYGAGA
jgi:hypothetical protein